MHALVTGASGFLGLYVVEQLAAAGHTVRALCRTPMPEITATGAEVLIADLRDVDSVHQACRGIECVFHVAGVAGTWGSWEHFYASNVLATRHVLSGCRQQGVPRLVYTSSPSVTFAGRDQCGIDESAPYPTRWLCHYSHSKALAEQEVLSANRPGELLTCALRPHLIWGPRDRHLVPRLLARAKSGQLRQVGDGTNRIDTVYVENAAAAHLLAAERLSADASSVAGKAYFISQGEPVLCWEWINQLLALAGLPPVRRRISARAAWRVGAFLETAYRWLPLPGEPRMTRFLAAQLSTSHYFDLTAARRDLGYEPQISTAEGLRRLAESWQTASA